MEEVYSILSEPVRSLVTESPESGKIEEIRLRIHAPLELITSGGVVYPLDRAGRMHEVSEKDIEYTFYQLSEFSLYAIQDKLREGYVTTKGGHRVGVSGQVVKDGSGVLTVKHISSLNIRVAKDTSVVPLSFLRRLFINEYCSVLVIGPPQSGKTTFIRELAKHISSGTISEFLPSKKVGVIDERSEIAASYRGIPSFNVGPRTDVLDNCPKAEGIMMSIRSMSPEFIIVDEIGRAEDAKAIMDAVLAGVHVICTAHGRTLEVVRKRPALQELFLQDIFQKFIILDDNKAGRLLGKEKNGG
ncbi:stage III sporulation protein AA [Alteribacillus sp. HJP-4]|uniref:stage III sporulation protein AA n=1 Tax=Alteribacillus sp. HJP-4 TaxID=2775394 RepID=UPI0035CD20F3